MSLVTTARLSSAPSSRQSSAISELLPVPTGPATPRRRGRPGGGTVGGRSGTEEPPFSVAMLLAPLLEQRGGGGGQVVHRGEAGDPLHHPFHLVPRATRPGDAVDGVERDELESRGEHGLHVLHPDQPRRVGGGKA